MKTFVIAEAGANHNKDWKLTKRLVYAAASAGASAVKFQNYTSHKLYAKDTPDFGSYKNIPDLISSIELPKEWMKDLKNLCDDCGVEFMSTPFDEEAVDLLVNLGVKRLKIAAFESGDPRLVRKIASTRLPVIFSAGIAAGITQVERTLDVIFGENPAADVTVLHCNSSYPTPMSDINLGQLLLLKEKFGNQAKIGLSDHTLGVLIPPVAVALGACVIEKHYTMSRTLPGPDHPFAIEPHELHLMCQNIQDVELSLGVKNEGFLTESESTNQMNFALRSLVAKRKISKGESLTAENVTTKRPFVTGNVPAGKYDEIIEKYIALCDLNEDEMIPYEKIERGDA